MAARVSTHLPRLRASARAAKVPATDVAALRLAEHLAQLLDVVACRTDADDGPVGELADEIEAYRKLGPVYLRTLTALGLTRDGRGVGETIGAPGGISKATAARDELRRKREGRAV